MSVHSPRPRVVTNGDVRLAVYEQGNPDGETLVLVHGWPDTHELWGHVIAHLEDRFRIVSYDTRGAGASSRPTAVSAYALPLLAGDLFAVIDAVSPDAPVHVLAHDWGAVETWEAVCEPGAGERIASYTSVSGPNLDHLGAWMRRRLAERRPAGPLAQAIASGYTVLFQIPVVGTLPFRLGLSRIWPTFLRFFDRMDPALVRPAPTLRADMITGLKRYRANIRPRLRHPRERRTDVPVQLIVDRRDLAVRPVGYEDTGRWVSNLRRRELPAGHWSPISHSADVARLTAEFVGDLRAETATDSADGASA
ncbi:alpha/beta fold hydrolase [Rhodococcus sp. SGAir0479]|uniref:alpha/beta fold hydrolase n=1 Tax=Rhodococcus sp. SGAir0479 TaxID=2567884 RepID=UPI0010CCB733|nr:alpha/beta fold hydrolase [Rhodococcus sp. SGAir0479]QCQ93075.1 alpha/beta fold hydrolase [Rhodococcus sp. SGAir0479]